jgi:hypothetical protein
MHFHVAIMFRIIIIIINVILFPVENGVTPVYLNKG